MLIAMNLLSLPGEHNLRRKSTSDLFKGMNVSKALSILRISEREYRELSDLDFRENFDGKVNSKNPWDQIFALFKIFNVLQAFEGKELDPIDKSLIQGIYSRKQHNFKHLE